MRDSLGYQLNLTSRRHEQRLENRLSKFGVTRLDFTVLCALGREGCSTPSEVADTLGVEKSAVSRVLRTLREANLLIEGAASSDKRVRLIGLSKAGHDVLDGCIEAAVEVNQLIETALSERERDLFAETLQKIRQLDSARLRRI